MDSDVHHHTATGVLRLIHPVGLEILEARMAGKGAEVVDSADLRAVENPFEKLESRVVTMVEPNRQLTVGGLRGLDQPSGLGGTRGQRLFAEYVTSRGKGVQDDRRVQMDRCGADDGVRLGPIEKGSMVGKHGGPRLTGGPLGRRLVRVGDRNQLTVRTLRDGLGPEPANLAGADDREFHVKSGGRIRKKAEPWESR